MYVRSPSLLQNPSHYPPASQHYHKGAVFVVSPLSQRKTGGIVMCRRCVSADQKVVGPRGRGFCVPLYFNSSFFGEFFGLGFFPFLFTIVGDVFVVSLLLTN